ncbi:Putative dual specificity protein phosphatase DSP8 [Apostasia shenzhenica]|uniref:Dual specificity protein phosphatase DSP8 n=1 Tax=Apostasia shenzhenica TaxID=1088818 RepID=A0A2I0B025_9ASPA|nr:Putative dual specificity protein phosphatase DSP8 [Apostasia shenzhenica]
MRIQELEGGSGADESTLAEGSRAVAVNPTRVAVGIGARFLFYPTLLYNVVRNKIEAEFRWWDEVDQPNGLDILGVFLFVGSTVHWNLNSTYCFLPLKVGPRLINWLSQVLVLNNSLSGNLDLIQVINYFLFESEENVSSGKTTYVHCKAGRGRSTTIVLCYLVQHRQMTPTMAYEYVRLSRPRVLLASSQWKAVQAYYHLIVKNMMPQNHKAIDDSSFVIVSKSDLDGYVGKSSCLWAELSLVYRIQFASQATLARISCLWLSRHADKKRVVESYSLEADQLGVMGHPCLVTGVIIKL